MNRLNSSLIRILALCCVISLVFVPGANAHTLKDSFSRPLTRATSSEGFQDIGLVGHFGGSAQALQVQGTYAYLGAGAELVILDVSNRTQPIRLGSVTMVGLIEQLVVSGGYAFATGGSSLVVVDISDPATPQIVSSRIGAIDVDIALNLPNWVNGIAIQGNYAYLACYAYGLLVVDISNPHQPVAVAKFSLDLMNPRLVLNGNYAYLTHGGLVVLDISNPLNPVSVQTFTQPYVKNISISGNYAYLAEETYGLRIVDISDPSAPSEIGMGLFDPDWSVDAVTAIGDRAYISGWNSNGLYVLDVSNPAAPVQAGALESAAGIKEIRIAGSYAYLASTSAGLRIIDVSQPESLSQVGSFQTLGDAYDVVTVGNYAYVADSMNGLRVIDINNVQAPNLVGEVILDLNSYWALVHVAGNYAYVSDGTPQTYVVDVSEPTHPVEVGHWDFGGEFFIAGNTLYRAAGYSGLRIVDITDPIHPVEMAAILENLWVKDVYVVNTCAYVVVGGYSTIDGGSLRVVDVSNPSKPVVLGALYYNDLQKIFVEGDFAYLATSLGKLYIVNITNPASPTEVGIYNSYHFPESLVVHNGRAYLLGFYTNPAHSTNHIILLDISDPTAVSELGYYTLPGESLCVSDGLMITAGGLSGLYLLKYTGYSIAGKVRQINGLPFFGATLSTQGDRSFKTQANGEYLFNELPASTYTITPTLGGYTFLPLTRTISLPPSVLGSNFIILPAPRSVVLNPEASTTLVFTDTQGLPTRLDFPVGAVTQTLTVEVVPTRIAPPPGYFFTGHAFNLAVSSNEDFWFSMPVTVTVQYSDWDIRAVHSEDQLSLLVWDGAGWQDAAATCGPSVVYRREVDQNTIAVPVCKTGLFALVGPTYSIYQPVVFNQ